MRRFKIEESGSGPVLKLILVTFKQFLLLARIYRILYKYFFRQYILLSDILFNIFINNIQYYC